MLFYTFQSKWIKDNINDLIKVTMDFGLDHSDYIRTTNYIIRMMT